MNIFEMVLTALSLIAVILMIRVFKKDIKECDKEIGNIDKRFNKVMKSLS